MLSIFFLFSDRMVDVEVGQETSAGTTQTQCIATSPRSVTPSPSTSSSFNSAPPKSSSRGPQQHRKRQRSPDQEIDDAICEGLCESRKRWQKRAELEAEHKNPDNHFGRDVGERLYRMTPRQKAITKVRIQQVLLEIEFPSEQYYQQLIPPPPPPQSTSYFTTNSNTYEL